MRLVAAIVAVAERADMVGETRSEVGAEVPRTLVIEPETPTEVAMVERPIVDERILAGVEAAAIAEGIGRTEDLVEHVGEAAVAGVGRTTRHLRLRAAVNLLEVRRELECLVEVAHVESGSSEPLVELLLREANSLPKEQVAGPAEAERVDLHSQLVHLERCRRRRHHDHLHLEGDGGHVHGEAERADDEDVVLLRGHLDENHSTLLCCPISMGAG